MAGIWDRIQPTATDRLPVHRLTAILDLVAEGQATGAQALTTLNEVLATPLTAAEQTDLANIVTQLNAASGVANKLAYFHRVESLCILTEQGAALVTESVFRNRLGIA